MAPAKTTTPAVAPASAAGVVPAVLCAVLAMVVAFASPAAADDARASQLIVATSGDDANPGTVDQPLRTVQRAVDLAGPGDVIAIREGRYAPTTNIQVLTSGTAELPITMTSYQGEHVVIDGEEMPHTPAPVDGSIPRPERGAIHLEASYWHFTDLEIVNGPYAIFGLDSDNNVFDGLITRDNYESGLHLQGDSGGNLIVDLDSYGNRDPRKNGESADGLAIKEGSGAGNVVRGARLWNNVDDGFDAWEFLSPIVIEDSVAWGNGENRWDFPDFGGDGNGFKLGGGDEDLPVDHVVRNSVAFDNTAGGFIDNANPGSLTIERSTAWRNEDTGFDTEDSTSTLTRNLSVSNGTAVKPGSSTSDGNSWDIGGTWDDSSVVSTDSGVVTGPREPDGAIPHSEFLVPVDGHDIGARFGTADRAAAPAVTLLRDTQLDPAALYFVSYDGLVNNESYQQDAILSHAGYQYTAWYTADRGAVVARRSPDGSWEKAVLPHKLTANDSHNVISLGISPTDGRLHVAMDTHDTPVHYVKSEAGLVSSPESRGWSPARFGAVQRTLDGVDLGGISYPQFVVTPEHRLQLSYRTGRSGNGTNELAEYDGSTWRALGRWSSATGSWTAPNGVTSTTRNMYLHGLTYGPGGRLHAAFTWREGDSGVLCNSGGLTNHDTGYVYSDDRGRTWRSDGGQVVGTTGGSPVAVSPSLVIDPLAPNHGLMNQESQAVDSTGAPHVAISYVPGRFTQCVTAYAADRTRWGRTFHVFRGADGSWTKREVPVQPNATGRTRLVFDSDDNAYLIMPFARIVSASKASGWTDWTLVFDDPGMNVFGEVNVDTSRVADEGVLSVLYQQRSTGTTPSPIRVADFRLG